MMSGPACETRTQTSGDQARENELIARICNGEKELYYELIRQQERSVYLTAFSVLRNQADAEEVAQDAILKAFRHLADFRGESRFGTWLARITINEARMRLGKQRWQTLESTDEKSQDDDGNYIPKQLGDWREVPSEALEREEIRKILADALSSLSEIYREILILRDVRQLSTAETTQILGISEGSVKTRLLRARLQMRALVAPVASAGSGFSRNFFKKGIKPWS